MAFQLLRSSPATHLLFQRKSYCSKGFLQNLFNKIKEESSRDIELKESIRKFREETEKLERSKELQSVRDFYKKIEKEMPSDTVDKVRDAFQQVSEKLREEGQRFAASESLKKSISGLSRAGEQMRGVSKSLGQTEIIKAAFKVTDIVTVSLLQGVEAMEEELQSDRAKIYVPPKVLKTRAQVAGKVEEKLVVPDSKSSGIVLHKDSKWYGAWQDFKDNNQYVQKFFDLKTQYEESEHLLARSMRFVTDRIALIFGGMSSENELQAVLDEIMKIDPNFDIASFLRYCRFIVIPNVLEAIVRGDMDILKDWCHEAPYNVLTTPMRQVKELGFTMESRVLDVHNVDIQMGKMMEQGPILVISFQTQQINCICDKNGQVQEGDPHKVLRVTHVWALCRDQSELHPWAAWRLLDIAMMPSEQWL